MNSNSAERFDTNATISPGLRPTTFLFRPAAFVALRAIRASSWLRWFAPGASLAMALALSAAEPAVFQADGIKIGEVGTASATVWTRLTRAPEMNRQGTPFAEIDTHKAIHEGKADGQIPAGRELADMQDAVPGAAGEVRVSWAQEKGGADPQSTPWAAVDAQQDFTHAFALSGLQPGEWYAVKVESRAPDGRAGAEVRGHFRTNPTADSTAPVRFIVTTCHDDWRRDDPERGFKVYPAMQAWVPDFFVQTGDFVYLDKAYPFAVNAALARFKWNRTSAWPFVRDFYRGVSSYFMKDDHDVLKNDCYPGDVYGELTYPQGAAIEREQLPMKAGVPYRTYRWGRDVQVWLLEGRDFRNEGKGAADSADKTLLGAEQKRWLYDTVRASDAAFRVIISGDAIVGPNVDYKSGDKGDSLSDEAFGTEGREIRKFLGGFPNTVVIAGDRHWQYHSIDPATGLNEFGCGPMCFGMAEGFMKKVHRSPMHQFLRIDGGFLSVESSRASGQPVLTLQYHDVEGKVLYTHAFQAEVAKK